MLSRPRPGQRLREDAAALTLVVTAWVVTLWARPLDQLGDIAVYARTHRLVDQGAWVYRDFDLEYPPLGAALFWVAGALPGDYPATFGALMLACLCVAVLGALSTAHTLGLGAGHRAVIVALAAATPFLLGSQLVAARYDLALAAVLAWIVATAVRGRWTACWILVAVGVLLKLTPLLLAPALLVLQAVPHRRATLPATVAATVRMQWRSWLPAAAVAVVGLVPALLASVPGTLRVLEYHLARPVQIESVLATPLLVGHVLGGPGVGQARSYGSDNVIGPAADALQQVGSVLGVAGVLAVAVLLALRVRGLPARAPELGVLALAATLAVAIATGKVLSPQYLIWLVPLVPLVRGWRGPAGAAVLGVAMLLSREVFPVRYVALVEQLAATPIVILATRNLLLVALAVLLVHALARARVVDTAPHEATPQPACAGVHIP